MPDPATRSCVVDVTSTSPGPAQLDGDAPGFVATRPLDLPRVHAGSHFEAELGHQSADLEGALDRAPWAVKEGEEPVASGVDLLAAKAL